jgi:raffinose/stachyose/melibiose transport system permease protein
MTATTMAKPSPASAPPLKAERRFAWGSPFVYFVIMLACGLSLVPVIYVILGGFRSNGALANRPVDFPDPWITRNYKSVLTSESFWTQVLNSTMIAVTVTAVVVVFGIMAAFVLARYSFPGREAVYAFFTLGLLFPIGVAILPLYLLLMDWNLLNSLWGVIIPTVAFQLPVTIVILRPFLQSIPKEMEEASEIDGCSRVGFFWRILLPLSWPGMTTVGVLAFVAAWNSYLLPLLVLSDPASATLPLGVAAFSTQYSQDTAAVLAFTSLAMLPALLFFTLAERRIVGSLGGAVKG